MFVVVADVKLKKDTEADFKKWFSEANQVLSKFDGFVSRQLLESKDGSHRVLVRFDTFENFEKMHNTQEHADLHAKAVTFMEGVPMPKFYNVVAE